MNEKYERGNRFFFYKKRKKEQQMMLDCDHGKTTSRRHYLDLLAGRHKISSDGAAARKELQMAPPHGNGCNIAILKLLAIAETIITG